METKLRLGVLYGGQSPEHSISLLSAFNVIKALDASKYEITLVGIDLQGRWFLQEPLNSDSKKLELNTNPDQQVMLATDGKQCHLHNVNKHAVKIPIDVVFPVLHGPNGEDGTIQGLCRMLNLPFVGPDVLGTAICMDKEVMKRLLLQAKLPTAEYICLTRLSNTDPEAIVEQIGLPCFVKPANMGSSVGVSRVTDINDLAKAINTALNFDNKLIIEPEIVGREIECAVLGNEHPQAAQPGEIIPHADFYSYSAKYLDESGASLQVPADIEPKLAMQIRELAIQAFQCLCCEGMARVDFFLTADHDIYINELNTIPGFTQISMYPKMWQESGLSYSKLIDRLIGLALEKYDRLESLERVF